MSLGAIGPCLAAPVKPLDSALFVECASRTRMFTDAFAHFGRLNYANEAAVVRHPRLVAARNLGDPLPVR